MAGRGDGRSGERRRRVAVRRPHGELDPARPARRRPTEPGPATWLDDTLVVYGGLEWPKQDDGSDGTDGADGSGGGVISTNAWAYRPPS